MAKYISHKNELYQLFISDQVILRSSKQFDAIKFITTFDCKIFDGVALAHLLKHTPFSVFQQYPENSFIQYICSELNNANRVDIVWYQFFDGSLKNAIKHKRDRGIRSKSSPQTAVPSNSKKNSKKESLKTLNFKNKIELFDFVTKTVSGYQFGISLEIKKYI